MSDKIDLGCCVYAEMEDEVIKLTSDDGKNTIYLHPGGYQNLVEWVVFAVRAKEAQKDGQ